MILIVQNPVDIIFVFEMIPMNVSASMKEIKRYCVLSRVSLYVVEIEIEIEIRSPSSSEL